MTIRETVQLHIAADSDVAVIEGAIAAQVRSLPQLQFWHLGRNLEGSWGAGSHTLDLHWHDAGALSTVEMAGALHLGHIAGIESADRVIYESIGAGTRDAGIANGIWRTLLLRTRPVAAEQVRALEQDLLRMPLYMKGIRNWQLSRVVSGGEWTHVWQQEYARIDDLLGEYLVHPFHWGWVDRWFDMEFPEWTVDRISHAFCPLPRSLLNPAR
jgi:hypothetical protein